MYVRFGKRLLDTLASLAVLPLALPLCFACAAAIRLTSNGPALFRQTRVGRDLRPFVLYKLRTMSIGTGDHASHEVSQSQVTPLGRFLRRFKLDELPQLINVIRGEMSLVGPRPCLPSQEVLVRERQKRGVYALRPGITGPAQIAGIDMSTPVELAEADARYLHGQTIASDLSYIAKTALGGGRGDAVTPSKP